ncbi:MAG: SH3 domain-containing protein [Desulfobaccales bacterium]
MLSSAASGAGARHLLSLAGGDGAAGADLGGFGSWVIAFGRAIPGVWTCALGLVICLMGCQPPVTKAPLLSSPRPPVATLPRPVRPTFYVTVNQLNLRACPGLDCHKISTLDLNAEVEKMGVVDNWTQIKVKKGGTIGYINSRYLSPHPVEVAQPAKKKPNKAKHRKATQPFEAAVEAGESGPQKQEPSAPLPRAM